MLKKIIYTFEWCNEVSCWNILFRLFIYFYYFPENSIAGVHYFVLVNR